MFVACASGRQDVLAQGLRDDAMCWVFAGPGYVSQNINF
ncbi:unnamed protein product [Ectocarpus sp. CCAP 1310/34]|nr:unnamed protein product [Ectocarpus sp. CCAP 1310/34]